MGKPRRREQAAKGIVRSRSKVTMEFQLAGQGGTHKPKTAYQRTPKHRGQGWGE